MEKVPFLVLMLISPRFTQVVYNKHSVCTLYGRYFTRCPSQPHVSLEGKEVDKDLINFQAVSDENRRNLSEQHFIDGENRPNVKIRIQTVYTTPEDRSVADNICNAAKEEF